MFLDSEDTVMYVGMAHDFVETPFAVVRTVRSVSKG